MRSGSQKQVEASVRDGSGESSERTREVCLLSQPVGHESDKWVRFGSGDLIAERYKVEKYMI